MRDWERDIIAHPVFQRLRRIRQLAWTDQVYPGAMHTRFEHSLGVMHVADAMFQAVVNSSRDILVNEEYFSDDALQRERVLVRLCALLHDVGHAPFSHAAEELFPLVDGTRLEHEDYSAELVRTSLKDAIESHPDSQNFRIAADDVASLLEGNVNARRSIIWRGLITGQLDADRIDYLLRDSLHTGVDYGRFDWRRLIHCLTLLRPEPERAPRLGVIEGGLHAAEGLVLARYFMFTQVYSHKTRVAFDHHLKEALKELLPNGEFPGIVGGQLDEYVKWDDWRVLGELAAGRGGEHGQRLAARDHYREVYHTPEVPTEEDLRRFEAIRDELGEMARATGNAGRSWYKLETDQDIPIKSQNPSGEIRPLSAHSAAVKGLKPTGRLMLYCREDEKERAREIIQRMEGAG
jgi:HD superfamily phosphohydrolase